MFKKIRIFRKSDNFPKICSACHSDQMSQESQVSRIALQLSVRSWRRWCPTDQPTDQQKDNWTYWAVWGQLKNAIIDGCNTVVPWVDWMGWMDVMGISGWGPGPGWVGEPDLALLSRSACGWATIILMKWNCFFIISNVIVVLAILTLRWRLGLGDIRWTSQLVSRSFSAPRPLMQLLQ